MTTKNQSPELEKVLSFLSEIGIDIIEKELQTSFLPGLSLGPNCLYIDFEKLLLKPSLQLIISECSAGPLES